MEWSYLQGNERLFVLFHGTGGNEDSLLFLTGELDAQASVLSFLGDVGVAADRRFFAPLHNGQLQQADFDERVTQFLQQWDELPIDKNRDITFVGYSNGANFIQGILQRRPDIASTTLLLHPSYFGLVFDKPAVANRIVITLGATDPLVPPGKVYQLKQALEEQTFSDVSLILLDGEHGVTDTEVEKLKAIYR